MDWTDFIATHKVFDEKFMSKQYRLSMIRTLQGLGLPTPIYGKKAPFGYYKEGRAFLPIESDLKILAKAIDMKESNQYFDEDILNWFNTAPVTKTVSKRTFAYMHQLRPLFPEFNLAPQDRIALINGQSPTSPAEETRASEG